MMCCVRIIAGPPRVYIRSRVLLSDACAGRITAGFVIRDHRALVILTHDWHWSPQAAARHCGV